MSRIRSRDTRPELFVRSLLHRMGYRFRLHRRDLPGNPDIVLPKYNTVIFVHGCFWHRHEGCKYTYMPKTGKKFWQKKFERNVERDREVEKLVKESGWRQITVWECEIRHPDKLTKRLKKLIGERGD